MPWITQRRCGPAITDEKRTLVDTPAISRLVIAVLSVLDGHLTNYI
jgi:hypothetical protein